MNGAVAKIPTVILVEDHEILRFGLRMSLETHGCCQVLGEAKDGLVAVQEVFRLRPDVVLMDVGLPGLDGIEATWRIKRELPRTRVIIFTSRTDPEDITAAFGAGADGYCTKNTSVSQIALAIDSVMSGQVWLDPSIAGVVMQSCVTSKNNMGLPLSDLEKQVLALLRDGMANREIAHDLDQSQEGVARVLSNLIGKFVAKSHPPSIVSGQHSNNRHDWLINSDPCLKNETIFAEKYVIKDVLGSGGIGAVFKARHLFMDRWVALKLIRPELCEDRLALRNFQREAMAVANLRHKNVVCVYDFGMTANQEPYLVMEYVEGTDLAAILEKERLLPWRRAIALFTQICAGMTEAHSKGVVHCDLKPSNILIASSAKEELVKLVDFGLAQLIPREATPQSQLTDKFYVCGTPLYMAPEQCAGKQLDARSDIYSLGCLFYESLTGVKPFECGSAGETFDKQLHWTPPSMASVCPEGVFPVALEHCVSRMLNKNPTLRQQTMDEVLITLLTAAAVSR